jgi:hypothetical protein
MILGSHDAREALRDPIDLRRSLRRVGERPSIASRLRRPTSITWCPGRVGRFWDLLPVEEFEQGSTEARADFMACSSARGCARRYSPPIPSDGRSEPGPSRTIASHRKVSREPIPVPLSRATGCGRLTPWPIQADNPSRARRRSVPGPGLDVGSEGDERETTGLNARTRARV